MIPHPLKVGVGRQAVSKLAASIRCEGAVMLFRSALIAFLGFKRLDSPREAIRFFEHDSFL